MLGSFFFQLYKQLCWMHVDFQSGILPHSGPELVPEFEGEVDAKVVAMILPEWSVAT